MTLKTATKIALVGVWLNLVFGLVDCLMVQFQIGSMWVWTGLQFILVLLSTVPLLVFLTVLSRKQQGD
jgi:hypothetical protein